MKDPRARRSDRPVLRLRRGTVRDAALIFRMIRGLADYEKLTHEVEASVERIRRHGFGRRRYFETLLCFDGREPIGFALYFFTYSTFLGRPSLWLEDLFVVPEARGRGAGKALLVELARIAVRRGCGRMEWTVLDWNTPSIDFYERLGARLRKDWILTRLTGEPLSRLAENMGGLEGPPKPPTSSRASRRGRGLASRRRSGITSPTGAR